MTKADEIKLLDTMIAKFGRDSYLGPWLAENRDRIVADLQSDFEPNLKLPGAAYTSGTAMFAETKQECANLIAKAKREADAIVEKAYAERDAFRESAARSLEAAAANVRRGRL